VQIAVGVASLFLALLQGAKETQPYVQQYKEHQKIEHAKHTAAVIAGMNLQWQYRGNDGVWRYYSDPTNRFWSRVNIQGVTEYSENPAYVALNQNQNLIR